MSKDQSASRNSELKPCPCCGGEARFDENSDGGHYIECNGCGLTTCLVFNLMGGADRELSEVWNRRAAVSEQQPIPEGCTVADAQMLREANHTLAAENHALRRCLRWYANGEHYTGLLHWEGPSGEDENWLCPPIADDLMPEDRAEFIAKLDEAMVENGGVARATLVTGKFEIDPEDEPKVVRGEPEWIIEQAAQQGERPKGG